MTPVEVPNAAGGGEMRRVNVVYFLSRNGRVEHPHLLRIHRRRRDHVYLRGTVLPLCLRLFDLSPRISSAVSQLFPAPARSARCEEMAVGVQREGHGRLLRLVLQKVIYSIVSSSSFDAIRAMITWV